MSSTLFQFLPFQQEYILSEPKILVVEKPRQVGITYTSGYKVVRTILTRKYKQQHYWLSRDEFTAKQFISNVLDWLHLLNVVAEYEIVNLKDVKTTKITFPNGSELFILSSSVDAVVGKTGVFWLDEFAIHQDQEQLMAIVQPCINWGGQLIIISTHRSKQTYFYKLCEKIRRGQMIGAKLISFKITDAIEQGLVEMMNKRAFLTGGEQKTREQFLAEIKANAPSEEIFNQEYMCIPADSDSTMAIAEPTLEKAIATRNTLYKAPTDKGRYFAGVDIGRHRDLTCVWVIEDVSIDRKNPMLETRFIHTISRKEFATQEKEIFQVLNKWKPRMIFVDGTNTGAMMAENIEKRYGKKRSQAIKITAVTRPKFIGDLVSIMDKNFLRIPDDRDVWDDFMSVSRYIGKHGNVDYWIPSRGDAGHGDRFMACVMAVQAFVEAGGMGSYFLKQAKVIRDLTVEEAEKVNEYKKEKANIRIKRRRRYNY